MLFGWKALAAETGLSRKALVMRMARGTLPLSVTWSEGRRTFDGDEVRRWINAGMPRRLH
jgi:predicted DNA-binding transcriptional regulator AlpA